MKVPRHPAWDDTFMECTMDDLQETLTDALKSRRKVFEERITITNFQDTVTITIRKDRRAGTSERSAGDGSTAPSDGLEGS